ncbi:hypothetical protein Hanom_Chr00s153587g01822811 [Helianthus anomalus]
MSSSSGSYSVRMETDNESVQPGGMSPKPYGDHHGNPLISFGILSVRFKSLPFV